MAFRQGQRVSADFVVGYQQAGDKNDVLGVSILHSDKCKPREHEPSLVPENLLCQAIFFGSRDQILYATIVGAWEILAEGQLGRTAGRKEVFGTVSLRLRII